MGQFFLMRDDYSAKQTQQSLMELFKKHGWLKVLFETEKRSLDVNSLSHVWYGEIAKQTGEYTTAEARDFCKLTFGVPILRGREKFNNFYQTFFAHLEYPKQLASMKYLSITSTMTKTEMKQYMNDVQNHFGARGVILSNAKEAAGA